MDEEGGMHADLVVFVIALVVRERRPLVSPLVDERFDTRPEGLPEKYFDVVGRRMLDHRRHDEVVDSVLDAVPHRSVELPVRHFGVGVDYQIVFHEDRYEADEAAHRVEIRMEGPGRRAERDRLQDEWLAMAANGGRQHHVIKGIDVGIAEIAETSW